jgi:carnitine O-acetyltransferase
MPSRSTQLPRAASLIVSSLGFIHDLRTEVLHPDALRGTSLDMDQYSRLFGTARIPTGRGCKMETASDSKHVVVLRRGQFCTVFCPCPLAIITDDLARTFRLVRCHG